jgi:hypothetical protein
MPTLSTKISKECDDKIRELAYIKHNGKKGSISKIIEEAIEKLYGEFHASNQSADNKPNKKTNQ